MRVGRRVQTAPNGREAILSFVIAEGQIYTMRSVRVELNDGREQPSGKPPTIFTTEQLAALMAIKAGDVYSADRIRKSVKAVEEAYGRLGRVDTRVGKAELRDPTLPVVDLLLLINESPAYKVGLPIIRGDQLTQQSVIRRELDFYPERPLDSTAIERTRQRLEDTAPLRARQREDHLPARGSLPPALPRRPRRDRRDQHRLPGLRGRRQLRRRRPG